MQRHIKIEYRHRRRAFGYAATAKLLLSGHWLQAAGFAPGTVAQVEVQAGRLIITPALPVH
ncbi:SymE family type I addiction module toxin [Hymenobacter aerophilus]|uniref:SymE family type I addiction module toxin n=2 Tax=Hymenobacter aerophilus TaxID=119644 RepID=UPI000367ACCB|nr:SymE family type I addiction module toxin [Hymenobacter aerophilus]